MKEEARKTMRVAVYCRLARADQNDTLLEVQKERLRVYAKERGYDVVAEIAEIGSGLSLNRPGIREMAGLAHRHMIDTVLVNDISDVYKRQACRRAVQIFGHYFARL